MKKEVIIATRNKKKFEELKRLLKSPRIKAVSLGRFSNVPKIVEDGKTFRDNAVTKALITSYVTNSLALADDSGLEVKYLEGRPGVFSSRFAGPKKDDRLNNLKLLRKLRGRPLSKRTARFRCVAAIADNGKLVRVMEGICKGRIGFKMEGTSGFGYDSTFIPLGYKRTFAQLGPKLKDRLSHRAKALKKAKRFIEGYSPKAL